MNPAARHSRDRARSRARAVRQWQRAAVIALPIVAATSLSTAAAFAVLKPARAVLTIPVPARGAMVRPDLPSPAVGSTGTIPLPIAPNDAPLFTDQRAASFRLAGASPRDRGRALQCLAAAIYYEAATESDDGERAVAQVVLNRVRHPAFPPTVCGVVYQGSDRPGGCQFSFACDGAIARLPSRNGWARALRIAADALTGQIYAPVGLATHYHTYAVTPAWNRTLVMTDAVGAHFFHRWKGYWGTAAAFTRTYRGGEPLPGPQAQVMQPNAVLSLPLPAAPAHTVLALAVAKVPSATPTPASDVRPAYAASGTVRDEAAGGSQVLDKWKESGQPRD